MTVLDQIECTFFQALQPPPDLSVSEWADAFRMLSAEASAEPGRWVTDRAPYQRGILDSVCDPKNEIIVIMSSAQVGKTEMLLNVIGYHIDKDPAPILLLQPTLEMAESFSKDRLATMLRDTTVLQGKVKDVRARDSGNTLLHKTFVGGHITMAGANSPSSLASRPVRIVLYDEVDRYPVSAGTEGDPIGLAHKRTATFWNRKEIITSTPTIKNLSRVEKAFNLSDQRRYYVACPECNQYQTLKWANVKWPDDRPQDAFYVCEHCGACIEHRHKPAMLRTGEWRATASFTKIVGFHLNELYSPWRTWGDVARDFLDAKLGGTEMLKTWVNTSLGETWEEQGDSLDSTALIARCELIDNPPTYAVTIGCDVQRDRLEATVVAWGEDEEAWVLDHVILPGDTAQLEVWRHLAELLNEIKPDYVAIDSGFNATQVYAFCQSRNYCYAIKGMPGFSRPFVEDERKRAMRLRMRRKKGGYPVESIGVDGGKYLVFSRLKIQHPGPGYIHFTDNGACDEEYFAQLTAEKLVTKYRLGRATQEWVEVRPRNEALDCIVYAFAALRLSNIDIKRRKAKRETAADPAMRKRPVVPPQDHGFAREEWVL